MTEPVQMLGPYPLDSIITGDARVLAREIPDGSVDLVFCDPVYDRIEDYEWLAETAIRVLKPDGNLLAFCWISYMREVLNALSLLKLEWILSLYIPNRTKDTRCKVGFNKWTPCLWLSRGQARQTRAHDILQCNAFQPIFGDGSSNHKWSKSPEFFIYYLNTFTIPNNIILDPFCGGGVVPSCCIQLDRRFIAFEIDPTIAVQARERLHNTQRPLPRINSINQLALNMLDLKKGDG